MMGIKKREFKVHSSIYLDKLVPGNNFYRQLESRIDLSFVRELVKDFYVPYGRASIDPVVFFKLQLIMFFEGIRSERQLMEQVHLNIAFRWYIGYDLDESVPDHSSLTKIRDRFGLEVFQQFFEQIIQKCIDAGLVWGKELHFDGTMVYANADYSKQVLRFYLQAQEHIQNLFEELPSKLVSKYDGTVPLVKPSSYHKRADYWANPIDKFATPVGRNRLGYHLQYAVDGGKSRIILQRLVTPASIQDNTPFLDLLWLTRFRWQLPLYNVVADTRFGTVPNVVSIEQNGIRAFIPLHTEAKRTSGKKQTFPSNMFQFDPEQNIYICPQGQTLHFYTTDNHSQRIVYKASDLICQACPVKSQCLTGKSGRRVGHSLFKSFLDRIESYQETQAYQKAIRKRQVWIEPKFAELKMWHQGRKFRLRGLIKVNIEAFIKASGQNIKQLLKARIWQNNPKSPAYSMAIALFSMI